MFPRGGNVTHVLSDGGGGGDACFVEGGGGVTHVFPGGACNTHFSLEGMRFDAGFSLRGWEIGEGMIKPLEGSEANDICDSSEHSTQRYGRGNAVYKFSPKNAPFCDDEKGREVKHVLPPITRKSQQQQHYYYRSDR